LTELVSGSCRSPQCLRSLVYDFDGRYKIAKREAEWNGRHIRISFSIQNAKE
jgi:hypothetical protein